MIASCNVAVYMRVSMGHLACVRQRARRCDGTLIVKK